MDSHKRFLKIAVETTKDSNFPILELGCGYGSTEYLHSVGREVHSYDSNFSWASKFFHFRSNNHIIECVGDKWDQAPIDRHWSLIFVDHAPGERRITDIRRLANLCELMIIHDTEPVGAGDYKYQTIWNLFKYKIDDSSQQAWTTMVTSNEEMYKKFKEKL